ncbi:hypothetical protein BD309DRAFT_891729 [Dichomitus squalens]|nr:hypothetical protein BD309DRAFT_891729 [Dichomitus squalens]
MTSPSMHSLPAELIESVLISAAAGGFPQAIAAFAQTCKAHHALVYNANDNHLWREIFLTTFDDPRASGGGPGWTQCTSQAHRKEEAYDWGGEFRRRLWAADCIRRQADPAIKSAAEPLTDLEQTLQNTRALETILSVVSSALPCPPTLVFSFLDCAEAHAGAPTTPSASYPTFPPLPHAIGAPNSTDTRGRTFGHSLRANNTAWLESVLSKGLPPEITATFSGDKWYGGLAGQFLDEPEFRELQAAGHIIACTGFLPIPQPPSSSSSSAAGSPSSGSPPAQQEPTIDLSAQVASERAFSPPTRHAGLDSAGPYMSVENQLKRARRLARMRVYNMRYLARDRHWGPYLPASEPAQARAKGREPRAPRATADDDELLQPILAMFRVTPIYAHAHHGHAHDHEDEDEDEEEDNESEYEGEDEDEGADVEEPADAAEDELAAEDEDAEGDEGSMGDEGSVLGGGSEPPAGKADLPEGPPSSAQLRTDWAYLAGVRVVVEANLRESFQAQDLRGLFSLDGLRSASAPYDWTAYRPPSPVESKDGKGKGRDYGEVEGWDWAGVTGVWKRCVCWMDYRDLILHNLSGEFEDPHLQEAVRIISMRLRIKSYSKSEVREYAHLPTIHVVGETTGASLHGQPRRMRGTVSVIADGSVRWTLYSTVEGGDMDEWVSEGIQVGGVASAMGVLGMWTGAQHERMDPLGPCWAWKVG